MRAQAKNDPAYRAEHPRPAAAAEERPPSQDELLLAQVAQSLIATRAQAYATMEQCDASLMVIHALQQREAQRIAAVESLKEPERPSAPRTFGAPKPEVGP